MDLLGDVGAADQLTSARAENAVLKEKVEKLQARVKVLTVENAALQAEVEIYRKEALTAGMGRMDLANRGAEAAGERMQVDAGSASADGGDAFVRSGDGVYPARTDLTLPRLHGPSNPLTCALSEDDTVLATGGADGRLCLCQWGAAPSSIPDDAEAETDGCAMEDFVGSSKHVTGLRFDAPVICAAFSPTLRNVMVAGGMDGSLRMVRYDTPIGAGIRAEFFAATDEGKGDPSFFKHDKYVKSVAWSSRRNLFASSSADGTVQLFKVERSGMEMEDLRVEKAESLHLGSPVESVCFVEDRLICYARGTPYLHCFDLGKDFAQTKMNLNANSGVAGALAFDGHVSFAVMDLRPFQDKFLALATDAHRNVIVDATNGDQVRNLYGHANDQYATPKVGWSRSGQYLLGNTQDDSVVVVWDIASSRTVERLPGHGGPVRDLHCSRTTDTAATTSFDKQTKIWMAR